MLDAAQLVDGLRQFCDPEHTSFGGFPTTRDAARQAWASAFANYLDLVQEAIVPPLPGHPMLSLAGVESAFFASLQLELSSSAPDSAADLAGAWQTGVLAVTAGGSIVDSALNSYVFVSFSNVPALHATLRATLSALFSAPSAVTLLRLTEIAQAIHAATSGLTVAVTITNASGASSPGTIGVL